MATGAERQPSTVAVVHRHQVHVRERDARVHRTHHDRHALRREAARRRIAVRVRRQRERHLHVVRACCDALERLPAHLRSTESVSTGSCSMSKSRSVIPVASTKPSMRLRQRVCALVHCALDVRAVGAAERGLHVAAGRDERLHVAQVLLDVLRRLHPPSGEHERDRHLVQPRLLLQVDEARVRVAAACPTPTSGSRARARWRRRSGRRRLPRRTRARRSPRRRRHRRAASSTHRRLRRRGCSRRRRHPGRRRRRGLHPIPRRIPTRIPRRRRCPRRRRPRFPGRTIRPRRQRKGPGARRPADIPRGACALPERAACQRSRSAIRAGVRPECVCCCGAGRRTPQDRNAAP